jgi:UDP-glucose 4-epimerase
MDDTRVLVTGGAGFIGSNLANHLAEHNDVIAVDDCNKTQGEYPRL